MAKYNWLIVREKDSDTYYPAMMDRDLKWVSSKDGFVNQNGVAVEVVYDLGKVSNNQIDPLWTAFRRGMAEKEKKIINMPEAENKQIKVINGKSQVEILKEILNLAKNELKEAEDNIGYTMPDGKYHLFIYVDEADEKLYVVEPNRVENGAHEPFTGDTYLVKYGDLGELMVGCMWAMECFERDQVIEKSSLEERINSAEVVVKGKEGQKLVEKDMCY